MVFRTLLLVATCLIVGCEPGTPTSDEVAHSIEPPVARSSQWKCEEEAAHLSEARQAFSETCGAPPRDCDPLNGGWLCSSEVIGDYAPAPLPASASACTATGDTLNSARLHYTESCAIPREDCDPVNGMWLCSSAQIGVSSPAITVPETPVADVMGFLADLSMVEQWNELGLVAVRSGAAKPTVTAHQLFVLSAAMYDAFAVYDSTAVTYALDNLARQPLDQRTSSHQHEAVSQAAYRALVEMFPTFEEQHGYFLKHLNALGYAPVSEAGSAPSGIGFAAASAVLAERRHDGSNSGNGYVDTVSLVYPEAYKPVNQPGSVFQLNNFGDTFNPNRWQPLRVPTGTIIDGLQRPQIDNLNLDSFGDQQFLTPHWGAVTPFALTHSQELRPSAPPQFGSDEPYIDALGHESTNHEAYIRQVGEVVAYSAGLTDRHKVIAEFWADGPRTESPPGHWNQIAHGIIERDNLSTGDSIKLLFTLNAGLLDASVATWETKRYYDYIRPASAIRFLFDGKLIEAWGGPNLGTQLIRGETWSPYQSLTFVTPPFPEYVSGHSTFSRSSAEILTLFTGSDRFYDGVTQTKQDVNGDGEPDFLGEYVAHPGSFFIEEGPAQPVVLRWYTFREAADQAGLSRLFGGIHIQDGDLRGRQMGAAVGQRVFARAQAYFNGTVSR